MIDWIWLPSLPAPSLLPSSCFLTFHIFNQNGTKVVHHKDLVKGNKQPTEVRKTAGLGIFNFPRYVYIYNYVVVQM